MNKLLSRIKAKFDATDLDDKLIRNRMDKVIKKYLFLFHSNIYSNSKEFNYREKRGDMKNWWFADIVYHPNSLLSISTGTYYLYQGSYHKPKFDKPPDINKVMRAFKKCMENRIENTEGNISRMKNSVNLIEQIEGIV